MNYDDLLKEALIKLSDLPASPVQKGREGIAVYRVHLENVMHGYVAYHTKSDMIYLLGEAYCLRDSEVPWIPFDHRASYLTVCQNLGIDFWHSAVQIEWMRKDRIREIFPTISLSPVLQSCLRDGEWRVLTLSEAKIPGDWDSGGVRNEFTSIPGLISIKPAGVILTGNLLSFAEES